LGKPFNSTKPNKLLDKKGLLSDLFESE